MRPIGEQQVVQEVETSGDTKEPKGFEPRVIAYVCNWCTYLGADLAGTNRLEYPSNVRIVRTPCTGRIDFNLVVKAFEAGADSVIVSGCHPGDCHYTVGNYHARRRWMMFRPLLETLGIDLDRIHFAWVSAAEGKKWARLVSEVTDQTRALGPYKAYKDLVRGSR
jgi:coenzyme F420-reducing hydrogenase delta subunit